LKDGREVDAVTLVGRKTVSCLYDSRMLRHRLTQVW